MKNNFPLVTCIIPVYNGEKYIKEAIDSILAQTHTRTEIIVIDDGSNDSTTKIVANYSNIRYIAKTNGGHASACNLGIKEAKGEFICFLDHDDLWHPEKLQKQHAVFQENPNVDICVTMVQDFYDPNTKNYVREALPGYVASSFMGKRCIFDKIGTFDEQQKHSHITGWFAKCRLHQIQDKLIKESLVLRRIHQKNLSFSNAQESHDEHLNLIKRLLDERRKQE